MPRFLSGKWPRLLRKFKLQQTKYLYIFLIRDDEISASRLRGNDGVIYVKYFINDFFNNDPELYYRMRGSFIF